MKRTSLQRWIALIIGIVMATSVALPVFASVRLPTLVVDGEYVAVSSPFHWEKGRILVSLEDLATYIDGNFQQNEVEETAWIQKYGRTVLFRLATGEVLGNGEPMDNPVPARWIDRRVYVPLRFVADYLGVTIIWNESAYEVQIFTGERHIPPERVSDKTFNATIAYVDKDNLWILDGRNSEVPPKQITDTGFVELVDWSVDGQWLAYKCSAREGGPTYLWVVDSDGHEARQVDDMPIYDDALWSPKDNLLAYTIMEDTTEGYTTLGTVKCARITEAEVQSTTLVDEDVIAIMSLAWHPDGETLAVSFPRTAKRPPRIDQVNLAGGRKVLHTLIDEEPIVLEGLYYWAFIGLKWSPDGHFLAHHLRKNSGSLTADVVQTAVLDVETGQSIILNDGLNYSEWMSFSLDKEKFAYIAGVGREAVLNKQLGIVDLIKGEVCDLSQNGYVDTQPTWLGKTGELLFCRGPEAKTIFESEVLPGVLVPSQRIYKLNRQGKAFAITQGSDATADYYPCPSPDGDEMVFLRLERFDEGSLYIQPVEAQEQAVEILQGLRGNPGYYGNYYPKWISVYWYLKVEN